MNKKFRENNNIVLYYNYKMSLKSYWNGWSLGSATFDKYSKKAYVTVPRGFSKDARGFSKDDSVLVIVDGHSFLARVEAMEKNGDWTIASMPWDEWDVEIEFWNLLDSGSEQQQVLVKVLPKSKQFIKPFTTIDLPSSDYTVLPALKEQIVSVGGLTLIEGAQMAGLDQFSQVTVKFDAGNPNTTVETFVADKVKAKHLKKGDNQFIEICDGSQQKGIIAAFDDQQKQERVDSYLDLMRLELREEGRDVFVHYSVSLVDADGVKVVVDSQSVKDVRRIRKDGRIKYALAIASGVLVVGAGPLSALPYTLTIEKKTVKKSDYSDWLGNSGMQAAQIWPSSLNQEPGVPILVLFSKKHGVDGHNFIELHDVSEHILFGATLVSLTVGNKTIYGSLKLGENKKVILTKPDGMGLVAWDKHLAALPFDGFGFIAQVALGSAAKPATIQLKIDLPNLDSALDVYNGLQNITVLTVAEASAVIGSLKVADALVSAPTAEINVLTATATIAGRASSELAPSGVEPSGLPIVAYGGMVVKWFNAENCLEITVPSNSSDKFTVCDSNDVYDPLQEQGVADFLDAAAADIQNEREKRIEHFFDLAGGKKIEWLVMLQSTNNREPVFKLFAVWDAEVLRTGSGKKYKFYLEAGQLLELDLNHVTILQLVRTVEQIVDVEKFVEDIAEQYDNDGVWYLKGDTIIEANAKLTIKAGQQLRLNRVDTKNYFTLTNKGTIILNKDNRSSGSLSVVNVNPANPLPAFTNDYGGIITNGGSIWLENGMTNNGTITNNGGIVNYGGTFTNNGRITNNATISIRNGAFFAGKPVFGRSITN